MNQHWLSVARNESHSGPCQQDACLQHIEIMGWFRPLMWGVCVCVGGGAEGW